MQSNSSKPLSSKIPQLALIFITLIWGGTFLTVQYALNFTTPMFFVGCRFTAAALVILLFSVKAMKGLNLKEVFAGCLIGSVIAAGYGTQTVGLQMISSSESAFLTALYVPLVPILLWIIFQKIPSIMTEISVLFAFTGLILLTGNGLGHISFNFGQTLTLIGSIAIALEIIFIGYFAGKVDVKRVTVIQLAVAALLSFAIMPSVGEHHIPQFSWQLLTIAIGLGIASAMIQAVMNWAQRYVPPSQAAIIYAGEPVWAGIFGRIAGERLPAIAILGAILVVLSVIISELKPKFLEKKNESDHE